MNKNSVSSKERYADHGKTTIHPIWRGVGFVMMIFIPVLSFLISTIVLEYNNTEHWFPIPKEFVINFGPDHFILMKLFMTVVIGFIIYALFMVVTFFTTGIFGPPREKPVDVPRHHLKKSR